MTLLTNVCFAFGLCIEWKRRIWTTQSYVALGNTLARDRYSLWHAALPRAKSAKLFVDYGTLPCVESLWKVVAIWIPGLSDLRDVTNSKMYVCLNCFYHGSNCAHLWTMHTLAEYLITMSTNASFYFYYRFLCRLNKKIWTTQSCATLGHVALARVPIRDMRPWHASQFVTCGLGSHASNLCEALCGLQA